MISFSLIKPLVISDLEVICSVTYIGVWFFIFFFFLENLWVRFATFVIYYLPCRGLGSITNFFFFGLFFYYYYKFEGVPNSVIESIPNTDQI